MPLIFVLDERYNPRLSFNTKDDLTNAFSGKLLQLESQGGKVPKFLPFWKKSDFFSEWYSTVFQNLSLTSNNHFVGPERKGPYVTFCGFWDNWRIEFSISKSIIGVNIKTNGALKTQKTFFNFSIFQKFARAKRALCVFHIIDSF